MSLPTFRANFVELFRMAARAVTGPARRGIQALACIEFADGSARKAETMFGWNRNAVSLGLKEETAKASGEVVKAPPKSPRPTKVEVKNPRLLETVAPLLQEKSQTDPKFTSTKLYTRVTGSAFRKMLVDSLAIPIAEIPSERTLQRVLNRNGHSLRKVRKTIPLKKIKETNQIFANVKAAHERAAMDSSILRISMDNKAKVKIGKYSRGGKTRDANDENSLDHDMGGESTTPVGLLELSTSQLFINIVQGPCTTETTLDLLEQWWSSRKSLHPGVKTIMIDLDNGPQVQSRRKLFLQGLIEFSDRYGVTIELVYYPPYHSKYNMIERCWGVLERHWNGTLLKTTDVILKWAESMTWRGVSPIVKLISKVYEKGQALSRSAGKALKSRLDRKAGIEKWAVTIKPKTVLSPT